MKSWRFRGQAICLPACYRKRFCTALWLEDFFDLSNRFQTRFVTGLEEFAGAASFIPAKVTDFWNNQKIGVIFLLVRDDSFNSYKNLGKDAEGRAWSIHEPGAIAADVDRDYDVCAQLARLIHGKICHQAAINQQ